MMCVQYIRGYSVHQGVFSTSGDIMSTSGDIIEYIGRCSVHQGDIMNTSKDVQCIGGYHDACGGASW